MTEARSSQETGFRVDAIFLPLQHCETVDKAAPGISLAADDQVRIGWDWAWLEVGTSFEVAVSIDREPSEARPEVVRLKAVARFTLSGRSTSVTVEEFALRNAPAMLVPYLRQAFHALTGNGPFGAQLLQPINVVAAMERFDPKKSTAAKQSLAAP